MQTRNLKGTCVSDLAETIFYYYVIFCGDVRKDITVGALEVPDRRISTTERLSDRKLTRLDAHWGPQR